MFVLDAPDVAPNTRDGLLQVANTIDGVHPYALYTPTTYTSEILSGENVPVPTDDSDKVFELRPEDTDTVVFHHYRGINLPLMEGPDAGKEIIRAAFEAGENLAVEREVQVRVLNPVAVDLTPTPLTPVTNAKQALGILEQYAGENYLGAPTISGNFIAIDAIPELSPKDDGSMATIHGTPIATAVGYGAAGPDGKTAPAGSAWLYISGQINIWRGVAEPVAGPAPKQNRELTLMERGYAASVEAGFAAAILVGF